MDDRQDYRCSAGDKIEDSVGEGTKVDPSYILKSRGVKQRTFAQFLKCIARLIFEPLTKPLFLVLVAG